MEKQTNILLAEIEEYLESSGMTATEFGLTVINDGHFVREMRNGRRCRLDTADRIRDFISQQPALERQNA